MKKLVKVIALFILFLAVLFIGMDAYRSYAISTEFDKKIDEAKTQLVERETELKELKSKVFKSEEEYRGLADEKNSIYHEIIGEKQDGLKTSP